MYQIESSTLSNGTDILRAVFSQINAEVRKKGVVLSPDDGSFYVSKRFSWTGTVKDFFDAYYKICERKQVSPIYQESTLSSSLKVPFADLKTINLLYGGAYERLLQFKKAHIPPFGKLSDKPDVGELKCLLKTVSDADIRKFLEQVILIDEELNEYVRQLKGLVDAYQQRLLAFYWADRKSIRESEAVKDHEQAEKRILSILGPYIWKLKLNIRIPPHWHYSFKRFPLVGAQASLISGSIIESYWNPDELPLASVKKAREKAELKLRKKAAKDEKRAKAKKAREDARIEKIRIRERKKLLREEKKLLREKKRIETRFEKARLRLSKPSSWMRFNKWVTKIGDWFADNIDDLTTWLMENFTNLLLVSAAIFVVVTGFKEGLQSAVKLFLGILIMVGICKIIISDIIEIFIDGFSLVFKYVSYIPLFVLRCIFFRGWTLLFVLLGVTAVVFYKIHWLDWLLVLL